MKCLLTCLTALGSALLIATGASAAPRTLPQSVQAAQPPAPASAPAATAPAAGGQVSADPEDREVQALLARLGEYGEYISKNPDAPQSWRYQMAQADVMLQLSVRSKNAKERDDWLRSAIDSYYSAAVQSPEKEQMAYQRLAQLPGQIQRAYPGNNLFAYAALQEVQADYMRVLAKSPEEASKAQEHLLGRLVKFAEEYPGAEETPKVLLDAAQLCETLGKVDDARRYYRHLAEHHAGKPVGRKANGSLWRLGMAGEMIDLKAPLLFGDTGNNPPLFDIATLRPSLVIIYFWTSASEGALADFQTLKRLTDRYAYRGLEVVFVNLDQEPAKAREFMTGRLTSGTHLHESGGLDSPMAEKFGLQSLPQAFVVGREGKLIQHTLKASEVEGVVTAIYSGKR
jgi:tetratricopeptide (TPR) repeat protein